MSCFPESARLFHVSLHLFTQILILPKIPHPVTYLYCKTQLNDYFFDAFTKHFSILISVLHVSLSVYLCHIVISKSMGLCLVACAYTGISV